MGGVAPWLALFGVAMILYLVSTALYLEFARLLPREPSQTVATAESAKRIVPADDSREPVATAILGSESQGQTRFTATSDDTRGAAAAEIPAPQPADDRQRSAAGYGSVASTHLQRTAAADSLARQETLRILYTDILQERARLIELQQHLARRPHILAARVDVPRQQASGADEPVSTSTRAVVPAATFVSRTKLPAQSADIPRQQTSGPDEPVSTSTRAVVPAATSVSRGQVPVPPAGSPKPLEPETAARSLQHLIRSGNDAVALNLLRGFSDRQAAKILARLWQQEPVVAKQLAQQLNRARSAPR